jgi:ribosomal protein S18 acetylase RimI-like enzyme
MAAERDLQLLSADDWAVLRDVRLRSLADSPDAFGSTLEREAPFDEQEWRQRLLHPVAVVLDGSRAVSVGGVFPYDGALNIWGMWTDPEHRGRGHARAVLDRLLAGTAERRVQLHVNVANPRARAVYEKYGFLGTGELEPLRPGSDQRIELMVLGG